MKTVQQKVSVDDLSERIRVVFHTTSRTTRGDIVKAAEIERCEIWAKILPLAARIDDSAPERKNSITYRITVRKREDLQPTDEIIWQGRRLKIVTPPLDLENQHIWTQIDCKEVIQDGGN